MINNRIRAALDGAIAALKLVSPDRAERLAAARAVAGDPSDEMLPLIKTALNKESDDEVKRLLNQARALDRNQKRRCGAAPRRREIYSAAATIPRRNRSSASCWKKTRMAVLSRPMPACAPRRPRRCAPSSDARSCPRSPPRLFSGLSLGSVLLLAALGLAITFGLMGIINMAHGEMLMLGAYTTYVAQSLFRAYLAQLA